MSFQFINEQSLTAAGVTTQYIDRLRNISLPPWLQELTYFDDTSMSYVQGYPIPEGQLGDLEETPAGSEAGFTSVAIKNVTVPNKRHTTGFMCDRQWLNNPQNTAAILDQSGRSLEAVQKFWVKRALNVINNGESTVTSERDSKYFFATDHIIGDVTGVSNLSTISLAALGAAVSGTPSNPSPEDVALLVTEAIVNMMLIKNGNGDEDYVNANNNVFRALFPLKWMGAATKAFGDIMSAQFIASVLSKLGVNQVSTEMPEMVVKYSCLPGLTATDAFYVFPTDTTEKPIVRRQTKMSVEEFGYDSEFARGTGMAKWLVELIGGSAPFYFERILKAKVTA